MAKTVEDTVEGLFKAIQDLVQIEAARAVYPFPSHEEQPSLKWDEDFDDEALAAAVTNLKSQLSEIVLEKEDG